MKVIKVGGGCLNGVEVINNIVSLIERKGHGNLFVVSALYGLTDMLIRGMDNALSDENSISPLIKKIKRYHIKTAKKIILNKKHLKRFYKYLNREMIILERYYYGVNFTREVTPRMYDMICCFGERISASLLSESLRSREKSSEVIMPENSGFLTDGKFGDATADIKSIMEFFPGIVNPLVENGGILFMPGFFGISRAGDITTFGRGGTDYSAAVAAVAVCADSLEFWKDVDGFMSADPRIVKDARRIPFLSYDEAAELSYFGAKILHPRAVEPARQYNLTIDIKNTLNPDAPGTSIGEQVYTTDTLIKSVTQDTSLGILKVHASGVGARPGVLADVANKITSKGINIKSVVTSQTCISILLDQKDLTLGETALQELSRSIFFREIETISDCALLSIVGDGMHEQKGIAGKCFTSIADAGVNVEMISFGPSLSALYFLVKKSDLENAVFAIHDEFFK